MNYLQDERGNILVRVGDQVDTADARFFVGGINESQTLCHIDKSRPWELLNETSPMASCIKQGNYSASVNTLKNQPHMICHKVDEALAATEPKP